MTFNHQIDRRCQLQAPSGACFGVRRPDAAFLSSCDPDPIARIAVKAQSAGSNYLASPGRKAASGRRTPKASPTLKLQFMNNPG
ncbi:MAG: hypothetical protein L0338_38665 [Acidobacteria bacterium]|nr:hypothetical protein [Acidobacteriota bacterium]